MSDSDDDDLFAGSSDSEDTAELVKAAATAPAAHKKKTTTTTKKPPPSANKAASKGPPKKVSTGGASSARKAPPSKDTGDGSDDDESETGLFDSDSDDDDDKAAAPKKAAPAKKAATPSPSLSKRERLEALAQKNRKSTSNSASSKPSAAAKSKSVGGAATGKASGGGGAGSDSEDTYDSANFQRTQEDDDFLDTAGEDPDAVQELYAEQHFDDERPEGYESSKKSKKRKVKYDGSNTYGPDGGGGDGERGGGSGDREPDNPIMAAVHRMKKKKREKKTLTELEDEIKLFLGKMELAAEQDEQSVREKRPALQKLAHLNEMVEMLTRKDVQRALLDLDVLVTCRRWIQPLPSGQLGNVTVRLRILEAVGNMTGDSGINSNDLKRSEFGKVVMALFKHPQEIPQLKMKLKSLIEQWSRPIFQKSGNMRDLERVAGRGDRGLAALARQHQQAESAGGGARAFSTNSPSSSSAAAADDLHGLIASGGKKVVESGVTRVRVPYSKGFAYSVRPEGRTGGPEVTDTRRIVPSPSGGGAGGPGSGGANADTRGKLSRRMLEKGRAVGKNQRSANLSIEGRPTK